jgi:hypothetical protein
VNATQFKKACSNAPKKRVFLVVVKEEKEETEVEMRWDEEEVIWWGLLGKKEEPRLYPPTQTSGHGDSVMLRRPIAPAQLLHASHGLYIYIILTESNLTGY